MYNTGKPRTALGKQTPANYLKNNNINNEDNSKSYLPLLTIHNNHYLKRKTSNNKVNVI